MTLVNPGSAYIKVYNVFFSILFFLIHFADASGSLASRGVCSPMLSLNPTWQSEPHLLPQFIVLN